MRPGLRLALPLALALAAVAIAALPASGFIRPTRLVSDLDGGRPFEVVRVVRIRRPGVDGTGVEILDGCPSGPIRVPVAGPQDDLAILAAMRADTRPGKEVFADLRSRRTNARGEIRVVAWRRARGPICRRPRELWKYGRARLPRGASRRADFAADIRNFTRRYRGRELKLVELYYRPGERYRVCASIVRRSRYRYSRPRDRYVRYARRTLRRRVPSGCA